MRQDPPAGASGFSATYVAPGGWAYDPPGQEGTARLVGRLVPVATRHHDRSDLARRLDRLGAVLSSQVAPESLEVSIWGPIEEEAKLLALLAEAVVRPRFAPDDISRVARQMEDRRRRERIQPAARADRELLAALFPAGHPYRRTGTGEPGSLPRIRHRELLRFHAARFTRAGGTLVVTTRRRWSALARSVRAQFRELPDGAGPRARSRPPVPRGRTPTKSVYLPGTTQVEVRLGTRSNSRLDPSYPADFLANELLGGRPLLARLFQRVREKEGLAYHASSELEAMSWGGYWVAQAGTGAGRWRGVLRLLEEEVHRLGATPVPARQLNALRESAIGEIALSLESTHDAHELAVEAAYYRLPVDHWLRWPEALRRVTPREVQEAARAAFVGERTVAVVAGPIR